MGQRGSVSPTPPLGGKIARSPPPPVCSPVGFFPLSCMFDEWAPVSRRTDLFQCLSLLTFPPPSYINTAVSGHMGLSDKNERTETFLLPFVACFSCSLAPRCQLPFLCGIFSRLALACRFQQKLPAFLPFPTCVQRLNDLIWAAPLGFFFSSSSPSFDPPCNSISHDSLIVLVAQVFVNRGHTPAFPIRWKNSFLTLFKLFFPVCFFETLYFPSPSFKLPVSSTRPRQKMVSRPSLFFRFAQKLLFSQDFLPKWVIRASL